MSRRERFSNAFDYVALAFDSRSDAWCDTAWQRAGEATRSAFRGTAMLNACGAVAGVVLTIAGENPFL